MQEVDLDNAIKYQKIESNYMEFSRNCAHNINKENRPKIWPNKAILAGQLRGHLVVFDFNSVCNKFVFHCTAFDL